MQILDNYFYDYLENRSTLISLFFVYKDIVSIFKDNSGSRTIATKRLLGLLRLSFYLY